MTDYYRRLMAGEGRSEALRQAQLAISSRPATAHPYYWAAFIVSGNPRSLDGVTLPPVCKRARNPRRRGTSTAETLSRRREEATESRLSGPPV